MKTLAAQTSAPVVLIRAVEPISVSLNVGEALIAGHSMRVLARKCPCPDTRRAIENVAAMLVATASISLQGAGIDVEVIA